MEAVKLLSLKCPRCGKDLEGDNNSRVFFCRDCRLGVDLSRGKESEYELECAQPMIQNEAEMTYFPFWKYAGRYWVVSDKDREPVARESTFWVPAFFIKSINSFGDIGLYYTSRKVSPHMGRCRPIRIFPADRGEVHAAVYPTIYAGCLESGSVSRVVELNIMHVNLVHVPFFRMGREYMDSLLGWTYPSGALI